MDIHTLKILDYFVNDRCYMVYSNMYFADKLSMNLVSQKGSRENVCGFIFTAN